MPGEVSMLKAALMAIGSYFGFKREQAVRTNAPEMKARAEGQTDQSIRDESAKVIAEQDAEAMRRRLAP
jgi:hypothetical protein